MLVERLRAGPGRGQPRPALAGGRRRTGILLVLIGLAAGIMACATPASPIVPATLDLSTVSFPPTAPPTPMPPGALAARRFIERVTSAKASYHVAISGEVRATISDLTLTGSIDVSGADVATSTRYLFRLGGPFTVQTRLVKGVAYWKVGPAAWRKRSAFSKTLGVAPFKDVNEPNVHLESTSTSGGERQHTLQVTAGRILDLTTIPAYNLTDEHVNSATWTIIVDDAGRPISGSWVLRGRGRVSGQLQNLVIELTATFSKVDAKITIKRP